MTRITVGACERNAVTQAATNDMRCQLASDRPRVVTEELA
jgi:hypothetical protein